MEKAMGAGSSTSGGRYPARHSTSSRAGVEKKREHVAVAGGSFALTAPDGAQAAASAAATLHQGRLDGAKRRAYASSSSSSGARPQRKRANNSGDDEERAGNNTSYTSSFPANSANSGSSKVQSNDRQYDEDNSAPIMSQSERKLHRERRRRNDLHLSFRRLITTLAKYHPEVSRRPATDDDVTSAGGSRRGANESFAERLRRAVESGDGARAVLAATSTDVAKLNRVDIIDCASEALEKLFAEKEADRAKLEEVSVQMAEGAQEIASLQKQLQELRQRANGPPHGQGGSGAGPMASGVARGPPIQIVSIPTEPGAGPSSSHQISLQQAAALAHQAIGPHNRAAYGPGMVANVAASRSNHGHATNMTLPAVPAPVEPRSAMAYQHLPAINNGFGAAPPRQPQVILGTATFNTVPTFVSAQPQMLIIPPPLAGAATGSFVLETATPAVGTFVGNSRASIPPAVNPIANLPAPPQNNQNANAAALAAASLMARTSNANSNSSGQFSHASRQS